jgi:signal transduction histidine kinase
VAAAWARRAEEELEGYGFELAGHPLEAALAAGTPHIRRDPLGDHPGSSLGPLYAGEGKVEELSLPLPLGNQRAALVFASREPGGFRDDQLPWLEDLARMVAVWVRPWAGHQSPCVLEQQYQALLDGALDGIAVVIDDDVVYANASFREIFGVSDVGRPLGSFTQWLQRDSLVAFDDALAWLERKARVLPRLDVQGQSADGRTVHLELGMQPVVYLGDPAVLVQVHNSTERVAREQGARDAAARTDALLRTLAHDIRGPLTSVIGFSQLLLERDQTLSEEHRREGLLVMNRSSQGLRHLVESLLEYSALGAEASPAEVVEVHPLLQQVESELVGLLSSSGATVEYRRIPPRVQGRAVELARVFRNLLDNGLRHRRPDVEPRIRVSGAGEEGAHYVFCVQDNGVGVEPHRLREIFGLFSRGAGGGAGVGLSIVERIVRDGGGRVWVESEPGEGSRFFFTLPKPDAEER